MYLESGLADGQFHLLFNITENMCNLADEAKASNLTAIVHPLWQQYTNIPIECPIEAVSKTNSYLFI